MAHKLAAGLEAGWDRKWSDAPPPGTPAGPLKELAQLGRGGPKKACLTSEPGVVAKVFSFANREDRWRREAALVEAAAAALPPHPNVLGALDVRLGPLCIQLLYPLFRRDLQAVLQDQPAGILGVDAARRVAKAVADGLGALHAHGLTHMAVKPAHILLRWSHGPEGRGLRLKGKFPPNPFRGRLLGNMRWGSREHGPIGPFSPRRAPRRVAAE